MYREAVRCCRVPPARVHPQTFMICSKHQNKENDRTKFCFRPSNTCYLIWKIFGTKKSTKKWTQDLTDHGIWFYDVFWKRGMISTSCFLPHDKISILAEIIASWRSACMYNCIIGAIFTHDFSQMTHFQNRSSPKIFEQSSPNFQDMF